MAAENDLQLWSPDVGARTARRRCGDRGCAPDRGEILRATLRTASPRASIEAAGKAAVPIDAETAALLRYADHCFALSGGLFDITSGVLRRAWTSSASHRNFRTLPRSPPRRALVDWASVAWDGEFHPPAAGRNGNRLRRDRQGIRRGSRGHHLHRTWNSPRAREPRGRRARAAARRRTARRGGSASSTRGIRRRRSRAWSSPRRGGDQRRLRTLFRDRWTRAIATS